MARGVIMAIVAAILFGASTPFAKLLLGKALPPRSWPDCLSRLGNRPGAIWIARRYSRSPDPGALLKGSDWGWRSLVILAGGIIGPVCLMADWPTRLHPLPHCSRI